MSTSYKIIIERNIDNEESKIEYSNLSNNEYNEEKFDTSSENSTVVHSHESSTPNVFPESA